MQHRRLARRRVARRQRADALRVGGRLGDGVNQVHVLNVVDVDCGLEQHHQPLPVPLDRQDRLQQPPWAQGGGAGPGRACAHIAVVHLDDLGARAGVDHPEAPLGRGGALRGTIGMRPGRRRARPAAAPRRCQPWRSGWCCSAIRTGLRRRPAPPSAPGTARSSTWSCPRSCPPPAGCRALRCGRGSGGAGRSRVAAWRRSGLQAAGSASGGHGREAESAPPILVEAERQHTSPRVA